MQANKSSSGNGKGSAKKNKNNKGKPKDPLRKFDRMLNSVSLQKMPRMPNYRIRQVYFPSATAFTFTAASGLSYTAATGIIQMTTNSLFWSLYFRLADLSNVGQLVPLFDNYKIVEVRVHFMRLMNISVNDSGTSSIDVQFPSMSVVDFDDSSIPANLAALMQYQNLVVHDPYKPYEFTIVPRQAVASGSGFVNQADEWVDSANQTVQHYGCKGVIEAGNKNSTYILYVEMIVDFKNVI